MTRHFVIKGHVQGVGYRAWSAAQAERLGVDGWVRNLLNGQVELLASGDESVLVRLEQLLHQGPGFASVEAVEVTTVELPCETGFKVLADSAHTVEL